MNFAGFAFALVFPLVLLARLGPGRTGKGKIWLAFLLCVSLFFYAWHVPYYLPILLFSIAVDFWAGRQISKSGKASARAKSFLILSLVVNLGLLALFKYVDFFLFTIESVVPYRLEPLGWVLPMGISFYTFQSMSYTLDIYRGRLEPEKSLLNFALYVSFFPQLVAGPIVRAGDFLYQLERKRSLHLRVFGEGIRLMIRGFFLKLVVADNLAPFVDANWIPAGSEQGGALLAWASLFAFSAQIFADFAGYTDIARGCGYLLGFRFPENFRLPYSANSFSDFWRRWHMTLSGWLRDYLYIPLGGNRGGRLKTARNLAIVMLLGGLWHGAGWNFVVWGALHGAYLGAERFFGRIKATLPALLVTQFFVLLAWIFFRSPDIQSAWNFLLALFRSGQSGVAGTDAFLLIFILPVFIAHAFEFFPERLKVGVRHPYFQSVMSAILLYLCLTCYGKSSEFIYFQF